VLRSPTVSVCLYNRVLVGYAPGYLDAVREWRQGITLTTSAGRDLDGDPLDGADGRVYELRFGAPPPLDDPGFWSVTMHGPNSLLVANPINRYSTRISRPGFVLGNDGSATVVMAQRLPEGVPEANWLPAPPGPFQVGLRLYYPSAAIRDGSWFPPPLRRAR